MTALCRDISRSPSAGRPRSVCVDARNPGPPRLGQGTMQARRATTAATQRGWGAVTAGPPRRVRRGTLAVTPPAPAVPSNSSVNVAGHDSSGFPVDRTAMTGPLRRSQEATWAMVQVTRVPDGALAGRQAQCPAVARRRRVTRSRDGGVALEDETASTGSPRPTVMTGPPGTGPGRRVPGAQHPAEEVQLAHGFGCAALLHISAPG